MATTYIIGWGGGGGGWVQANPPRGPYARGQPTQHIVVTKKKIGLGLEKSQPTQSSMKNAAPSHPSHPDGRIGMYRECTSRRKRGLHAAYRRVQGSRYSREANIDQYHGTTMPERKRPGPPKRTPRRLGVHGPPTITCSHLDDVHVFVPVETKSSTRTHRRRRAPRQYRCVSDHNATQYGRRTSETQGNTQRSVKIDERTAPTIIAGVFRVDNTGVFSCSQFCLAFRRVAAGRTAPTSAAHACPTPTHHA